MNLNDQALNRITKGITLSLAIWFTVLAVGRWGRERMIPIEDMLNIICTEATEDCDPPPDARQKEIPSLQLDLELIELPDGRLEWVD